MADRVQVKKKVLIVRTTMGQGGADRVASILMHYLDRSRYEISLLLMKKEGEHLAQVPADVQVFETRASSLWFFLPYLRSHIKTYAPDVIFSIDGGANIPVAIATFISPFRKWKSIVSERNILFPPGKNKVKRALMVMAKAIFYRFADVLTAVSAGVRTDMKRWLFISPSQVQIVYNPMVEPPMLQQSREPVQHPWFSESREVPVIVHAGRFVHQKDHVTLIKAFALVREKTPCRLFLLGDGPLQHSIKAMVEEMKLTDVYFAGFDLNPFRYFSKCDVFVLSSLHEGMPGVLIQAMACGAPSVSTNCPSGPDEIIDRPGENGILVPVQQPDVLAEAITGILINKSLSETLRKNGPIAVKKFAVDEAIQSYLLAIES
jgi:glycosyltransferase involved in cell wall biosynthesis